MIIIEISKSIYDSIYIFQFIIFLFYFKINYLKKKGQKILYLIYVLLIHIDYKKYTNK